VCRVVLQVCACSGVQLFYGVVRMAVWRTMHCPYNSIAQYPGIRYGCNRYTENVLPGKGRVWCGVAVAVRNNQTNRWRWCEGQRGTVTM